MKNWMKATLTAISLTSSWVLALEYQPPPKVAECEIGHQYRGKDGYKYDQKTLSIEVTEDLYFHGGPSNQLIIGDKAVILGTNDTQVSLVIIDGRKLQDGPADLIVDYTPTKASKESGGFSGNLIYTWEARNNPYSKEELLNIVCYLL